MDGATVGAAVVVVIHAVLFVDTKKPIAFTCAVVFVSFLAVLPFLLLLLFKYCHSCSYCFCSVLASACAVAAISTAREY